MMCSIGDPCIYCVILLSQVMMTTVTHLRWWLQGNHYEEYDVYISSLISWWNWNIVKMALNIHTPVYYVITVIVHIFGQLGCFFGISYQYLSDREVSCRTIYVHALLKIAVTIKFYFNLTLKVARNTRVWH